MVDNVIPDTLPTAQTSSQTLPQVQAIDTTNSIVENNFNSIPLNSISSNLLNNVMAVYYRRGVVRLVGLSTKKLQDTNSSGAFFFYNCCVINKTNIYFYSEPNRTSCIADVREEYQLSVRPGVRQIPGRKFSYKFLR